MTSGDAEPSEDEVQFGRDRGPRATPWVVGGVAVLAAAVVVLTQQQTDPAAQPTPSPSPHSPAAPTPTPAPPRESNTGTDATAPASPAERPQVASTDLTWLHASSDWEVFARTDHSVVRIEVVGGG